MIKTVIVALAALVATSHAQTLRSAGAAAFRDLSLEKIAGYEPTTAVTDHNAIDQDQKTMEEELGSDSAEGLAMARAVYELGGNSKSYAVLTLEAALSTVPAKGTVVAGVNAAGAAVTGKTYSEYAEASTTLEVQYETTEAQLTHSSCRVGGLNETTTTGCFAASENIMIGGVTVPYTYDVANDNNNGRTLSGFSTSADKKMRHDEDLAKEYYDDFQKFFEYYGAYDYSDQIVKAAFLKQSLTLSGKTLDFTTYNEDAVEQIVKKTSAFVGVAMYAIRELEDALDDCRSEDSKRNADSVNAVDEAVAFYSGSLVGADGSGSGVFMYTLADKRCANFKTCGETNDAIAGTSKVNIEIFKLFSKMKNNVVNFNCDEAEKDKEKIVKLMWVPLIQGTLRYAQIRSQPEAAQDDEAEGAAFAFGVLPMIHSCDENAATTVFDNMKPGSAAPDHKAVKSAIERTYGCLGITCADVGGYYDTAASAYYKDSGPCGGDSGANVGLAVGLSIGGVVILAAVMLLMKRQKAGNVDSKV